MSSKRFYNAHLHCFTYDHVPEYFLSRRAGVSRLLKWNWLQRNIKKGVDEGKITWVVKALIFILHYFLRINKRIILRYFNFFRFGDQNSQEDIIRLVQQYYPKRTGFVLLTMDMEYMGAGKPKSLFKEQLSQLAETKLKPEWNNKIFPFIFCDPRRIKPIHKREIDIEKEFIGETFLQTVKQYVEAGTYSGIKIYPALGYYPFDQRMQPVYDLALSLDLPVLTHCTIGAVHFKYELDKEEHYHPFLKKYLPEKKPVKFQEFFTHPLNFECLLNQDLLKQVWGNDAPDYSQLKICIAHWGTEEEWHQYLENPWVQTKLNDPSGEYSSLNLANWNIERKEDAQYVSWFSIISDLITKYPNVYTDISYTLNDTSLLPLLKMTLEANDKIRERVLFGTDFYMVSKAISEREFAINVRAALGQELFEQIAITNTERFLSNKLYPMPLAW